MPIISAIRSWRDEPRTAVGDNVKPVNRHLLQVTIDDAIAADEIFSVLMGEQVEPRRNFISENALSVKELDVLKVIYE